VASRITVPVPTEGWCATAARPSSPAGRWRGCRWSWIRTPETGACRSLSARCHRSDPSDGRTAVPPRFSHQRQIFLPPQATSPGRAATAGYRPHSGPLL